MYSLPICYNIMIKCPLFPSFSLSRYLLPAFLLSISLFLSPHPSLYLTLSLSTIPGPLLSFFFFPSRPTYMTVHLSFFFFPSPTTSSAPGNSASSLLSFTDTGAFSSFGSFGSIGPGPDFQGTQRAFGPGTYGNRDNQYSEKDKSWSECKMIKWNWMIFDTLKVEKVFNKNRVNKRKINMK